MSNTKATQTAAFGLALLQQEVAAKPGENVLISPFSVALALGMTANGARGNTLTGINTALRLGNDQKSNNKGFAALLELLDRSGIGVTLDVANAFFARLGLGFKPEFLETNQKFFNTKVDELDFDDPATIDVINGFVADSTNNLIDKLLKDPISADTIAFLINCVYFKGEWTTKFEKTLTEDLPFVGVGDVPTMLRHDEMIHDWDDDREFYQFVSLPFGESKAVRMMVFLPNVGKSVEDVLAKLDEKALTQHIASTYERDGLLWLPRIDIAYENSLKGSLMTLGMEDAFGGRADFSGMRQIPPVVFVKDILHKTVFKVDEEGAEAAAVTSVEFALECARMPFEMRVDRPFLTFIVDSQTNAILFAGVIINPTK